MDETKDTDPKEEATTPNDTEPSSPDTLDNPDPNNFTTSVTLVVSPPDDDRTDQSATDDDAEENSMVGRVSVALHPDDEASVTDDDLDKQPSTTEADVDNTQPPQSEEDVDNTQPPQSEEDVDNTRPSQSEEDVDNTQPPQSEEEAGTSGQRRALQLQLLRQEAIADSDLDQEAAHTLSLRRRSQQDSGARSEVVMEMDTFNRSSTRRDSFVQAIESGVSSRETDSDVVTADADSKTTTEAAFPATQDQTADKGSLADVEEVEIFMDEENDYWQSLRGQCRGGRLWLMCGVALLLLAVVSAIILVPQSLVYVEYYQMALARSRLTGRVDRDRTLHAGCYLLFPDTELVLYKATAHHVLSQMEVTSADGLSLGLQLSLQYFINGEELGELHREYGQQYEQVVGVVIESEAKNAVVNFTLDQYRLNRSAVQDTLYSHLARVLQGQGDCCSHLCVNSSNGFANCNSTCNASSECLQGLHMTLLPQHVHLGALDIPKEVNERFLRFALLQVEAEKETLLQESTVQTKLTELLTRDIRNKAHEVLEAARWTSRRLQLEAEACAELRRQRAYNQALGRLLSGLNITAVEQRLSLLLLLAYRQAREPFFFVPNDRVGLFGGVQ